ncbi:ABC transporter ATP-binding protein [Sinimarinibacterium sp. CAU 1509]|uniref:ABC transporter ATP-binding protein n=1 Tax=Sinimarinibacterium sp. CAU 1509 TaxID=2562283 RepID=UPI0010AC1344|nr:ABC transporter ATP-binding protein [Sinimarinibacterium sp. CAU 1509]TJY58255.1 ABC transporter ATP-binding protein [Sinimarinibacterium sp. CAU 1509]
MESEVLIEARGLTRRYGPTVAVDNLSLTLRKGEILGLLGPNGAGKSTTMKMLTGNLAPTEGEVLIGGKSMHDDAKAAKRSLGYLPEQPPVYPELTVDEYLRYCATLHGVAKANREAAVDSAKRDCGLTEVGSRLVGNLSKGFQQRVGIAQAIIHRPPVVVLDEPTVGLDPIQIREIRSLITQLGQNHSVILSSHILPEVQAVCGRVIIIARGRVVYNDSLEATRSDRFRNVRVGLRRAPEQSALAGIAGIKSVTALGDGLFRCSCAAEADPRDAIAEAATQGNWGLYELSAETHTLEEIFVELTSGDDVRSAA